MDILSSTGVELMNNVFSASSYEDFLQSMKSFNELGAAQLDREDEARRETVENETLAQRQVAFTVSTPQGRAMRVERAANGVVTLSETSLQ